jgi:hypothetical protein
VSPVAIRRARTSPNTITEPANARNADRPWPRRCGGREGAEVSFLAGLIVGIAVLSIAELILVLWAAGKVCGWIEEE